MPFQQLQHDIDGSVVNAIDESILFEVETDASAATVNQAGRPVASFSSTLQRPDTRQASIEREAREIIETVRHWRHYLTGKHFILKTDQQAVMYMFDKRKNSKIKNDKIVRWSMGISCFNIMYSPLKEAYLLTLSRGHTVHLRAWAIDHYSIFTTHSATQE